MLNDVDLAALAAEAYTAAPTWRAGDVHALYTFRAGESVVAIRGTTADPRDWLRDLSVMPKRDRALGFCHAGFLDGARALFLKSPLPDRDFSASILTGHSMGGALALLLGGLLAAHGSPPRAIVTFGAPRCGSWTLRRVLRDLPLRLYRNGDDPVPEVPWLPGFYVHPAKLIAIGDAALDPLDDHPIAAYRRALAGEFVHA